MKSISVKFEDPYLHYKLKYISYQEGRSANRQIIYLIRRCIEDFEKKHGVIEKNDKDDSNSI